MRILLATSALILSGNLAMAAGHAMTPMVEAADQSVAEGTVTAARVIAGENGWLVVHRTADGMKPGPVVGYAPLKMGENINVNAILQDSVQPGDKLMLMVHAETGGMQMGTFEYSLGAKEDGPIRVDEKLVMKVISAN